MGIVEFEEKSFYKKSRRKRFLLKFLIAIVLIFFLFGIFYLGWRAGVDRGINSASNSFEIKLRREQRRLLEAGKIIGNAGIRDEIENIREKAFRAGYYSGIRQSYERFSITPSTTSKDLERRLGTPDKIEYVLNPLNSYSSKVPCWRYGDVKIILKGVEPYSTVLKWEGNIHSLVNRKKNNILSNLP